MRELEEIGRFIDDDQWEFPTAHEPPEQEDDDDSDNYDSESRIQEPLNQVFNQTGGSISAIGSSDYHKRRKQVIDSPKSSQNYNFLKNYMNIVSESLI